MNKEIKSSEKCLEENQNHFQVIELSDCDVPIGCPWGADPAEDVVPDHHGGSGKGGDNW